MKFDCPYCGKKYEVEGEKNTNSDLLFTCSNCGKFVGLFQKVELTGKIDQFIYHFRIIRNFAMILFTILVVVFFIIKQPSKYELSEWQIVQYYTTASIPYLIILAIWYLFTTAIIKRFSALSFQIQKQHESVELQKYLIGQIKK